MAKVIDGQVTDVHTTAKHNLGELYEDKDGNVYIYALGVASVAVGSVCAIDLTSDKPNVALLTETIGAKNVDICVAPAAIVASSYGWFQIAGVCEVASLISNAADAVQYCTTTAGSIDDAGTTRIVGIRIVDTAAAAGNITAHIRFPKTNTVA